MKSLFYSWMVSQLLVGIWLFISPFVFGLGDTHFATNNMIFGAIVVISLESGLSSTSCTTKRGLRGKQWPGWSTPGRGFDPPRA